MHVHWDCATILLNQVPSQGYQHAHSLCIPQGICPNARKERNYKACAIVYFVGRLRLRGKGYYRYSSILIQLIRRVVPSSTFTFPQKYHQWNIIAHRLMKRSNAGERFMGTIACWFTESYFPSGGRVDLNCIITATLNNVTRQQQLMIHVNSFLFIVPEIVKRQLGLISNVLEPSLPS